MVERKKSYSKYFILNSLEVARRSGDRERDDKGGGKGTQGGGGAKDEGKEDTMTQKAEGFTYVCSAFDR